jgi:hypothetical protein
MKQYRKNQYLHHNVSFLELGPQQTIHIPSRQVNQRIKRGWEERSKVRWAQKIGFIFLAGLRNRGGKIVRPYPREVYRTVSCTVLKFF